MYTIFATGLLLWIVYGIVIGAWPIVIANSITALQAIAILWMKVRFSHSDGARAAAY
jgi:MtN3 and saliva related transmembrane protein